MTISEIIASYNGAISQPIPEELRTYELTFTRLINEAHIPLEALIALEPAMREELRTYELTFTRLINEAHIPLETLIALEPAMREELRRYDVQFARLFYCRQTHRYLIINEIITEEQLSTSLLSQNQYLTIQNFVNAKLTTSGHLPE